MHATLDVRGAGADERTLLDLQDWILRERIDGLTVRRQTSAPRPGEMGAELDATLAVVLGSAAMVELVRCVQVFLQARKQRLVVELKAGERELRIEEENPTDSRRTIERAVQLFGNHPA